MSIQTKEYIQEMQDMYLSIMKKVADLGELTTTDMLFLELYEKTIKKDILR